MSVNGTSVNGASVNGSGVAAPPIPQLMVPFDQSWDIAESPSLPVPFDQSWDVEAAPEAPVPFDQSWGILADVAVSFRWNLPLVVDASFLLELPLKVQAALEFPMGSKADAEFKFPLGLLAPVNTPFTFPLPIKDTDPVDAPFDFPLPLAVQAALGFPLPLKTVPNAAITFPLPLSTSPNAPFTFPLSILAVDPVAVAFDFPLPLLEESAINVTGILTILLVKTGELIQILSGNLDFAEGDYNWSGEVVVAEFADFQKFAINDLVTLTLDGEAFEMIVDETALDRNAPASRSAKLRLLGRGALFDTPRVEPITIEFQTPISANAAAEQILGTTIDWQLIDWLIPAGRLGATSASPVEVVQKIAEAGGGLLETNPDGTFFVRDLYPVTVPAFDVATPDHQFFEATDILQQQETLQNQELENRLRIRDTGDGGTRDRIVFEADESNGRQGTVKVFPNPFRDITLDHTSDAAITIVDTGEQIFDEEDQIEIREGSGNASFPILSIDTEEWMDDDLGPLTFVQDETEVQASNPGVDGYGLVTITYKTRAKTFFVSSPVDDDVQFIVRDC